MEIEIISIHDLVPYGNNAKEHPKEQIEQIKESIIKFHNNDPIAIDENNVIIEGHGRYEALKELGYEQVECIRLDHLNDDQKKAYRLVHNKLTMNSDFNFDLLEEELKTINDIDMGFFDFDLSMFDEIEKEIKEEANKKLTDEFLIPPTSVFDTRQGYWQERKRAWKDIGISSEVGRDEAILGSGLKQLADKLGSKTLTGTSIFDSVLCEIIYKWFNVHQGNIFDCFAGGSVRGIVAEKLGYKYTEIDLRKEQVEANILNANELNLNPTWICDDSLNADLYIEDNSVDLLFSCPPYADLEVYSDDERDISNMDYEQFKDVYKKIIDIACKKVKDDRFAVFVVGDVRDKKGYYRNFVDYTKECFNNNGFMTYNEIILLEQLGTIPMRARLVFKKRKVAKAHQNILIFYKGDINNIPCNYSNIEVGQIEDTQ